MLNILMWTLNFQSIAQFSIVEMGEKLVWDICLNPKILFFGYNLTEHMYMFGMKHKSDLVHLAIVLSCVRFQERSRTTWHFFSRIYAQWKPHNPAPSSISMWFSFSDFSAFAVRCLDHMCVSLSVFQLFRTIQISEKKWCFKQILDSNTYMYTLRNTKIPIHFLIEKLDLLAIWNDPIRLESRKP